MDLVAATSVIPGPNSSELALAIGRRHAGWPGFLAAGAGFILPAVVLSVALAWLALGASSAQAVAAILVGIDPVVVAILTVSVFGLGRSMAGEPANLLIAGLAALAYLAALPEIGIFAVGAAVGAGWRLARRQGEGGAGTGGPSAMTALIAAGGSVAAAATSAAIGLVPIFLVFLKAGALLFGSGYVLVALLRADLVEGLGWITERQLLDAIAVGQATPGPLLSTAGYLGFVLAGLPGAIAAAAGIFLPAFVLVALLDPIVTAVRARPLAAAALRGAGAAALGLMAGVTLELAAATLAPGGALAPLPLAVAVGATVALASGRVGPTILILAGGIVGLARVLVVG